jgi:hypothetical protein
MGFGLKVGHDRIHDHGSGGVTVLEDGGAA